jgi:hypothetical protein
MGSSRDRNVAKYLRLLTNPKKLGKSKRQFYPWSPSVIPAFIEGVRGDGIGERECGSLWYSILRADD